MKYELCCAYSLLELENYVNKRLYDGWELYGSPFCAVTSKEKGRNSSGNDEFYNEIQYIQAMVKNES